MRVFSHGFGVALFLLAGRSLALADDTGLAPPVPVQIMDQNRVSLTQTTSYAAVPLPSVTIGQQDQGGLEYHDLFDFGGGAGIYTTSVIYRTKDITNIKLTVVFDGQSENFGLAPYTSPTTPFSAISGNLAGTLSFDGTLYTYTTHGGTVGTFSLDTYDCPSDDQCPVAAIQQVQYPNGEIRDYVVRLAYGFVGTNSMKSNLGYQIKLNYACASPNTDYCYQQQVQTLAINSAYDYCDPTGNACSGMTYSWPSLTYGTGGIVDSMGHATQILPGTPPADETLVQRPSGRTIGYYHHTCDTCDPGETKVYDGVSSTPWLYQVGAPDSYHVVGLATDPLGHVHRVTSDPLTGAPLEDVQDYGTGRANITTTYDVPYGSVLPSKVTFPEGNYWNYTYAGANITQIDKHPKPGSSDPVITLTATYPSSCTSSNYKVCNKPLTVTDGNGNTTTYTYSATQGGVLTETGPAVNGGQSFTQYTYTAKYAWYKTSSSSTLVQDTRPVYKLTQVSKCRLTSGNWNSGSTTPANVWGGLVYSSSTTPSCAGSSQELVTTYTYEAGNSSTPSNLLQTSISTAPGDGSSSPITSSTTYDKFSNIATTTGPLSGQTSTFFYDADREQTGAIQPAPDDTASGNYPATRTSYDDDGRVIKVEQGTTTIATSMSSFAPLSQKTMDYDSGYFALKNQDIAYMGYVSSVPQPVSATQYSYDGARNPQCTAIREDMSVLGSLPDACTKTTPGSNGTDQISQKNFDGANRLTSTQQGVDSGHVITTLTNHYNYSLLDYVQDANGNRTGYSYDGHMRLSQMNFPSKATPGTISTADYETYCYDNNSNRSRLWVRNSASHTPSCSGSGGTGNISYTYDAMNRVTHKQIEGGGTSDVYYNFDLLGDLLAAQFGSTGGQGITYSYDAWGRKLTETSYGRTVTSQYDAAGNRTNLIYPDGVDIQYVYDVLNRMKQVKQGTNTLAGYTYDDLGRTVGISRQNSTATSVSYTATSLDRSLTQDMYGTSQDVTYAMTFTPAPQLASRTISNSTYAYSAPAHTTPYCANGLNQYGTVGGSGTSCSGGTTYTYDDRGNLTYDGSRTMSYDLENRLTAVTSIATLSYDPKGRLQTFAGSSTQQFQYDGDEMAAEYNSSGSTVLRRYVPGAGADETLLWYEGADLSTPSWLHTDEQGTTIATSNSSGAATTYRYSPTGEPTSWAGARLRYTGQAALPDVALYYYKARMYDPTLGRFLQTDPVGFTSGDLNLYAYVNNNPTNDLDPSGTESPCVLNGNGCGLSLQNFSDNLNAVSNFFKGALSYPEDVGYAARFDLDRSGLAGQEAQNRAMLVDDLAGKAGSFILNHPGIARQGISYGVDWAIDHPAFVLGRASVGLGLSGQVGAAGMGITGYALTGGAIHALNSAVGQLAAGNVDTASLSNSTVTKILTVGGIGGSVNFDAKTGNLSSTVRTQIQGTRLFETSTKVICNVRSDAGC